MPTLRLCFLGTLHLCHDDQPLPRPSTLKSQSLLAYLVLHRGRPQSRERLADLFWGDRPDHKARRSLATALWHIRRCLPAQELVLSDAQTIQFDPRLDLWLDVEAFESQATRQDLASLQSALDLYRGDFLEDFYDDWIINERHRLETVLRETLTRLMLGYETRGGHEAALTTALRLLERDPLREDAHRLAMRVYCRLGQRNAALEQYQYCCQIVQQELDTTPMIETTELYQAILEGHFAIGPVIEIIPVRVSRARPPAPPGRNPLDLIAPVKLVGREQELAFLHRC
jgi:DNA-binding SARP family transcriptional activator